uniref:B30.2/SPRY domain-containing protein n=1 Tax=Neolamprologus brichardi TaxID=32507 RepID=A0A3Q4HLM0_NEOBR
MPCLLASCTLLLCAGFSLGHLYTAYFTLWDMETIKKYSTRQNQTSSNYEITASDSIESKFSLLDVSASVKASFLGGLIEVGGSARYLNDNKKSKNQSRVTLHFSATTAYERLAMTHLEAKATQIQDVIKKSGATHVVTGILYGANAFFVFDSEKLESSSVKNIEDNMQAAIKKLPACNFEAEVDVKLSDEEKAATKKFSCKFYGAFILDSNPSTFEDAVKTYSQLPKLLGGNGEKTVPVKVWLTTLNKLDPTAEEMKSEISVGLLRKAVNVVENFPQIHKKLSRFHDLCEDYAKKLRQTMMVKIPAIREGKEKESTLQEILGDQEKSPFSLENLDKWLYNAEREINVIRCCLEIMKGIKISKDESKFDKEVFTPGVQDTLCFIFTSLETDDPYLDQMDNYLHSGESPKSFLPPTKDHWFFSEDVIDDMKMKSEDFSTIVKGLKDSSRFRFFVSAIRNEKYKGATIYHYKKSNKTTEEFSKPAVPNVEAVEDREALIWYGCDLTLDLETANNHLILSEDKKMATCGELKGYDNNSKRFDLVPQVLCSEGLTGRHYWEVQLSTDSTTKAGIAVMYQSIQRKGEGGETEFGANSKSWYVGTCSVTDFTVWHNGKLRSGSLPSSWSRVGVFLDYPSGTVSFYTVSSNTLTHLHTFHTTFTEPVYPGFWIKNISNYCNVPLRKSVSRV